MINYVHFADFYRNSIDKQYTISYSGHTLTNADLYLPDGISLEENICTEEQLKFGYCESSKLTLKISSKNVSGSLVDEELDVSMVVRHDTANPLHIGKYKVVSDTPDRLGYYRTVVAYDSLYGALNADFTAWYNALTFPMTLKQFRDSFFTQAGITQETVTLINDGMAVTKTISPTQITGSNILTAICEVNACFGHIGRDGKFKYIVLEQITEALYPAEDLYPSETLYPSDESGTVIGSSVVVSGEYESATADFITELTIRDADGTVGVTVGSGVNKYLIQNNFLLYNKSAADLTTIATNIFNKIKITSYRPANLEVVGNPCLEVGDIFVARCNGFIVRSYVLSRTLTGTQSLRDRYISRGKQIRVSTANTIQSQIQRLGGRQHEMIIDIDTFRSAIYDEHGNSKIDQNAQAITLEVNRAEGAESGLSSRISQNATKIEAKVSKTSPTGQTSFSWAITDSQMEWQANGDRIMLLSSGGLEIKGKVTATGGAIGNFGIYNGRLRANNIDIMYTLGSTLIYGNEQYGKTDIQGTEVSLTTQFLQFKLESGFAFTGGNVTMSNDLDVSGDLSVTGVLEPGSLKDDDGVSKTIHWEQRDHVLSTDYVLVGS